MDRYAKAQARQDNAAQLVLNLGFLPHGQSGDRLRFCHPSGLVASVGANTVCLYRIRALEAPLPMTGRFRGQTITHESHDATNVKAKDHDAIRAAVAEGLARADSLGGAE